MISTTQITATAPAATGAVAVDVTVTTVGGTSTPSSADQFTYASTTAPMVTQVSPAAGPTTGGNVVTITGTNLSRVTAISFGIGVGTPFTVNPQGTSITVTAPAHAAGPVTLYVEGGGIGFTFPYTYVPAAPPTVALSASSPSVYSALP